MSLNSSLTSCRYQAHPHNRLPPHRQWTGRTSPPSAQGFSISQRNLTQATGLTHYPWCCLASILLSRNTSTALLQSLCMVPHAACPVSSSVHLPQTLTRLHTYSTSRLPCSSFILHLSFLIIALFTFPTASPHAHMYLFNMIPSTSRYNIPMMAHIRGT